MSNENLCTDATTSIKSNSSGGFGVTTVEEDLDTKIEAKKLNESDSEINVTKFLDEFENEQEALRLYEPNLYSVATTSYVLKKKLLGLFMVGDMPHDPIKVTPQKLNRLRLAYHHYANLIVSHITMVQKDIQSDLADTYEITAIDLVYLSLYGERAFSECL